MENIPLPVASQLDSSLMKLVAINQRGSCKDFVDLKILIEQNNFTFRWVAEKLTGKYNIGSEMYFQLKKSLVYFDDTEKDLNIYSPTMLHDYSHFMLKPQFLFFQ